MKKYVYYVYMSACVAALLSTSASAYLDPSVMTYTIQVVAGVGIAAAAAAGIVWRRAKKKIQDKLGIDENARKKVEADIVEFTDEKEN